MQFPLHTIEQLKPLIQGFRKQAGLTQAAMAEKLGITQQSYAQIESNLHVTSVERLYTILRLLHVQLNFSFSDAAVPSNLVDISDNPIMPSPAVEPFDASDMQQRPGKVRQSATGNVKRRTAKRQAGASASPTALKQPDKTKW